MQPINDNRTLYLAVTELCRVQESNSRSLEDYLSALFILIQPNQNLASVSVETFFQMLESAFVAVPEPFHETWRTRSLTEYDPTSFAGLEQTLIRQIVDLREMDEVGTLKDEYRFYGVDAPSGARWYNFMPSGYIECATAGIFGGWQSGDAAGRGLLNNEVRYVKDDGTFGTENPKDLRNPVFEIAGISWEEFFGFLECGRLCE